MVLSSFRLLSLASSVQSCGVLLLLVVLCGLRFGVHLVRVLPFGLDVDKHGSVPSPVVGASWLLLCVFFGPDLSRRCC